MKERKVSGGIIRRLRYIAFVGAAFFQNNPDLVAWVNSQLPSEAITCLGDGHDGVWNLFNQIGTIEQRTEVLDWYHLIENLYRVGGSLKRLRRALPATVARVNSRSYSRVCRSYEFRERKVSEISAKTSVKNPRLPELSTAGY